jgi:hypothetical protein
MDSTKIIEAVEAVTKRWAKQRKAEERSAASRVRRHQALVRSRRTTIKEAAWGIIPRAYLQASSDNTLPAHARQVMYAARGHIQQATGKTLDDQYFTQTLLPDYLRENPQTTADWDVVFDARGHFAEPHTRVIVPLGTIDVRDYLCRLRGQEVAKKGRDPYRPAFPTVGPRHRFNAVLFIEKEGFLPLFQRTLLAERFDIAIMSTKGVSVTGARRLVDELSGQGVPCLVVRDFDKVGFTIVHTLQADGRRYEFQNRPKVIDLGLRLNHVRQYNLTSEEVFYGNSDPVPNLRANGATRAEMEFLCAGRGGGRYAGQRVELNAFASRDLVAWLEGRLEASGIRKVIPNADVLAQAFRLACERRLLRRALRRLRQEVAEEAKGVCVPENLKSWVRNRLKKRPDMPWDRAVDILAAQRIQAESPG